LPASSAAASGAGDVVTVAAVVDQKDQKDSPFIATRLQLHNGAVNLVHDSLLHKAAREGNVEQVKQLLKDPLQLAFNLNRWNDLGFTPLHEAILAPNLPLQARKDIIAALIDAGAFFDMPLGLVSTTQGQTVLRPELLCGLILAANNEGQQLAVYIDEYRRTHGRYTASSKGDNKYAVEPKTIEDCICPSLSEASTITQALSMSVTSHEFHFDKVRLILERYPAAAATAFARSLIHKGETILHWAIRHGNVLAVKYIVERLIACGKFRDCCQIRGKNGTPSEEVEALAKVRATKGTPREKIEARILQQMFAFLADGRYSEMAQVADILDGEADDMDKVLLKLGLFNLQLYRDTDVKLCANTSGIIVGGGKELSTLAHKFDVLAGVATAPTILGHASKEKPFNPSVDEKAAYRAQVVSSPIIDCSQAPVELFELWLEEPHLFKGKTLFLYGAVNRNEWFFNHIVKHPRFAELSKKLDPRTAPIVAGTIQQAVTKYGQDLADGKTTADVLFDSKSAQQKACGHLVMAQFFDAFETVFCIENFPLFGAKGNDLGLSAIDGRCYPVTAAHNKALLDQKDEKSATPYGRVIGKQNQTEALEVALDQAAKLVKFIENHPNRGQLEVALRGVLKLQPQDNLLAALQDSSKLRDQHKLIEDIKKALTPLVQPDSVEIQEKGKTKKLEFNRIFNIWGRTITCDYQVINADPLIAVMLYERGRPAPTRMLTNAFAAQRFDGFDEKSGYPRFVDEKGGSFYYPVTIPSGQVATVGRYIDLVYAQLTYFAGVTLQPLAWWNQLYEAIGLYKADPYDIAQDEALCAQIREVFTKPDFTQALQLAQQIARRVDVLVLASASTVPSASMTASVGGFSGSPLHGGAAGAAAAAASMGASMYVSSSSAGATGPKKPPKA